MSPWRELPLASVVLVSWNSLPDLRRCLASLATQHYPYVEIIVVDNGSTDGTIHWIKRQYPEVHLLRNSQNIGFAAAVNQGFAAAQGEILVELNPDTVVEPGWLFPLVDAFQNPGVGLVTSRVMLMTRPWEVNACGNEISLTGLTFCIKVDEQGGQPRGVQAVPAVSGAAFAMSRSCYETIGAFDPDYFTYYEDTDLSLRARLAGFQIVLATDSVVYHDYTFRFSPSKMFWIERNRHVTLLKHLRKRTLLALLPPLLLGEVIAWGYAAYSGPATLRAKGRAFLWLLCHMGNVRARHKQVQMLRKVEDEVLVAAMSTTIRFDQTIQAAAGRTMNGIVEPFLKWWQRNVMGTDEILQHQVVERATK